MSQLSPPRVAVVGGSSCTDEEAATAEAIGRLLAEAGAILITGGRGGIMAAASKGARQAGGLTVGILPGDDTGEANAWLSVPIVTGIGEARNVLVVRSAQAIIAIGGKFGTLSEIALSLKLGRPVIGLDTWRAVDGDDTQLPVHRVHQPTQAVELAIRLCRSADSLLDEPTARSG